MAYDLLIKNGMVVDGTGAPARRADVAIANGKIAEIGQVTDGATENMKDGDVVEVEIPGIGVLRNPVVRER